MSAPALRPEELSAYLRSLRGDLAIRAGHAVRQVDVARAIGVSIATVSAWEKPDGGLPPPERLEPLARFYAAARSVAGGVARLVGDLDAEERARFEEILAMLRRLRAEAGPAGSRGGSDDGSAERGQLGGRFWYYPGDIPITIITTPLSPRALTSLSARGEDGLDVDPIPYSDRHHPNYVGSLRDGDRDATIELYGHIRAENPQATVRYRLSSEVTPDDLTTHVVILGNGDAMRDLPNQAAAPRGTMTYLLERQEWPWYPRLRRAVDAPVNDEFDTELIVALDGDGEPRYYPREATPEQEQVIAPVFVTALPGERADERGRRLTNDYPELEYDIAVLARRRNELNLDATITIASGIFSRGTLGAVRALTHPTLRAGNEDWLYATVNPSDFWAVLRIPVAPSPTGLRTITPDLAREKHVVRLWSAPAPARATRPSRAGTVVGVATGAIG